MGPDTLGIGKRVEMRITPYGFIVESPGGLRGVSQGQLHGPELAKAAVNQRLYEMAKRLRTGENLPVIEGEGGGMREVFEAMEEWGLGEPKLFDNGTVFRVVLRRAAVTETLAKAEFAPTVKYGEEQLRAISVNAPSIVRSLESSGQLSVAEIARETGLSSAQVRYAMTALVRENVVHMIGRQGDRRTWYRLTD
ncbi:ATP-binding protein [Corynebacterium oculi]|nr:ATP-binding protein [Corynebacterium oculi]